MSTQYHNRFQPQLEVLEYRVVLNCSFNVSGGTLEIDGDSDNNKITINDDGTGGADNIEVICDGDTNSFDNIDTIIVNSGSGKDKVRYNLEADLQGTETRDIEVNLGDGKDLFKAKSRVITPGSDADLQDGAKMNIFVFGEDGDDRIRFDWGRDHDLNGSSISKNKAVGGKGEDKISWDYLGDLDGKLAITGAGGPDDDKIGMNIAADTGSDGKIAARMHGKGGDDLLSMIILENRNDDLTIKKALVNGSGGFDTAIFSELVTLKNVEDEFEQN